MRRVGVILAVLILAPVPVAIGAPSLNGRILFERPEVQIVSVAPDGSDAQALAWGYEPAWSPDGHDVAFGREFRLDGTTCCGDIWLLATGAPDDQRSLEAAGTSTPENPQWSPTGQQIAYQVEKSSGDLKYQEIWVVDRDGGNAHPVARANEADRDQWSWSPDGTQILVQQDRSLEQLGPMQVAIADVQTGATTVLGLGSNPSWSPGGKRVVFTRSGRIYSVPAAGGRAVKLAIGDVPRFSPDGRRIAFVRYRRKLPPQVLVMARDGSNVRRVGTTWTPYIYAPVWSPDGRSILWEAAGSVSDAVYAARVNEPGSKSKLARAFAPGWSRPACTASGTMGADTLVATASGDVLCGFGGDDRIAGGPGPDRVFGDLGDDVIDVRGGGADAVSCGPGHDVVLADRADTTTRDCEVVRRS